MIAHRATGSFSRTNEPPPALGSRVRLHQVSASQLPAHPDLAPYQEGASSSTPQTPFEPFVTSVLNEANTFITKYLPAVITTRSAKKTVPPSNATVQLAEYTIPAPSLPAEARTAGGESWFIRSSLHEGEKKTGTADWEEFEGALLDRHSEHEQDYTPDVFDAHRVISWHDELAAVGGKVGIWEKVEMNSTLIFERGPKAGIELTLA